MDYETDLTPKKATILMDTVKAGKPLLNLVALCHAANRPLLLSGHHGVGKSEVLEQAARDMGIDFISRDLSLMEPPDLIGLPKAGGKNTIYLPPVFLPQQGRGLLVFEELNRCERFMQAPCLQLLTSRTLNDYNLPDGWLPVAAINPANGDYEVGELDPALLARFVQVHVIPDRDEWLDWSRRHSIHPAVVAYVQSDSTIFDKAESNPRAWRYASDILLAAEKQKSPPGILRAAILGLVGDERGAAFLQSLTTKERPLSAADILDSYSTHRDAVQRCIAAGRLDMVSMTLLNLMKFLQPEADYKDVFANQLQWRNLARFLRDLPGDFRESARKFFQERKYSFPQLVEGE